MGKGKEKLEYAATISDAKLGKGKEKVEYATTRESWYGNTGLDSADTDTTRTPRGRTKMDSLAIQRVKGIKKDVAFNKLGQPVGEAAIGMQSYIGVVAREKVKISYKTWKQVPIDVKELICDSVNLSYNVDAKWKKGCLRSANSKWRQYKAHLTQTFILGKLDKPEELYEPPAIHGIPKDDWSAFVISRMSGDFIKLSEQQKDRRKQNVYPHRLSRKGYARFASEIDDYIQQKRDGVLRIEGTKEDILSKALETKEYDGRVRGIGGHVTPTLYFNAGRTLKSSGVPTDVLVEHERKLMEANRIISE
ncbi:uncharacterized protein [Henckelia pumila]|uniref:uncharacterized protein n=1 Tax=Henckelia pumila TaxID=405737 RepID=UPI003C6DB875